MSWERECLYRIYIPKQHSITEFYFLFLVKFFVAAFVAKLDILLENVNTSPKPKVTSSLDNEEGPEFSAIDVEDRGINS